MKVQAIKAGDGRRAVFDFDLLGENGIRVTTPDGATYIIPRVALEDAIHSVSKKILLEIDKKLDYLVGVKDAQQTGS